ncbi:MAG: hypothetical protein KDH92_11120 [Chloroflexi bacterium]|nr:hypothetical protein [Chloroflexota bacterium]
MAAALLSLFGLGMAMGRTQAAPAARPQAQAPLQFNTLRVHGYPALGHPDDPPYGNWPATAGSNSRLAPVTGQVPEDPAYSDGTGPFDPLSPEAPEMDFVTWNPAWISERLNDPRLREMWPGLDGIDEVSAGSNIRASGVNGSEKVWLRHWYEPMHLDVDLNADGRLTSDDTDDEDYGVPDAPVNPTPNSIDEWYPAIMTELTYMLVENDPLPLRNPDFDDVDDSAPRPMCGRTGNTRMVFPVGVAEDQLDPGGDPVGYGLTSLDANLDGQIDMVNVADELSLSAEIGGIQVDFDGDGAIEAANPDGVPLSCDEMVVMHTDPMRMELGQRLQFLDHYVEIASVANSSAQLDIYYTGDLVPRRIGRRSIGIGALVLAGEASVLQGIGPGGNNIGNVPVGPWFVYVQDVDPDTDTAIVTLGRALGAPCASMTSAPLTNNFRPGTPYYLKRLYVDGHEYNVTAIYGCSTNEIQYITLRAPVPKADVTIELHSMRLQGYWAGESLPLPPPFNYQHTILEDVVEAPAFANLTNPAQDENPRPFVHYMGGPIGPVPPVLGSGDMLPYLGRDPNNPISTSYDDIPSSRWMYSDEDVDPAFLGELREKYGAPVPDSAGAAGDAFFYNEQIFTLPWNFTEFSLPNLQEGAAGEDYYNADDYLVTTAFVNPTSRWRRWLMPDQNMPAEYPPTPPDLVQDITPAGGFPTGAPRRASFRFDPDNGDKLYYNSEGVRLYGGQPDLEDPGCDPSRPILQAGAGDLAATDTANPQLPVEVAPYTDPFAPFNPQHAHAPRGDLLTVNPAYMDEFRNFGEDLVALYRQISNNGNAREKVYHRIWYQPDYVTKIRYTDDCERDLRFPAMMQEFTYAYVDMTDNPGAALPGSSNFAFPIGTRAEELPEPQPGGILPAGGEFGFGLTTFDADFDDEPDAVELHSEQTIAAHMDTQWQSNRPSVPGVPLPPSSGPILDFDGDGIIDDLDQDGVPLTGDEMVVFALTSVQLDLDTDTDTGASAMLLDYAVTLENVTRGQRAQLQLWFTGGGINNARPEKLGGPRSLNIGDAALVDRFQNRITIVPHDGQNTGTDGAWFVFLESVDEFDDRVTVTIGRALGASHSAIDNGLGAHDLLPGDPWYLKRFYVDGHEYNVTAVMTQATAGQATEPFQFISIRTPVPKGNFFNDQDSLFQQGYFLDGLPPEMSVMPPFNVDHTIARDIDRIELSTFADPSGMLACTGPLEAADPLRETIREEEPEPRLWSELREIWSLQSPVEPFTWETDQQHTTPYQYTDISLNDDQVYLLALNWTSPVSRLAFYGCLPDDGGPFPEGDPGLGQDDIAAIAEAWTPLDASNDPNDHVIIPVWNRDRIVDIDFQHQDVRVPYYDARIGSYQPKVKLFYDPTDPNDVYINPRTITVTLPADMDMGIEKRLTSPNPAQVGESVTFAITLTNTGDMPLTDVDVIDSYDTAHLDYVSASIVADSVDEAGGEIRWQDIEGFAPGGTFDPGESIVITVNFVATAETPPGGQAVNRVRAVAVGGTVSTDLAFDDVRIVTPRLEIDKQLATEDPTTVGSTVSFTVTLHNAGTAVLTDVDVSDTFDTAYLDFLSASLAPSAVNEGAGTLAWQNVESSAPGGTFDPGEDIVILVDFTATAATPDPVKAKNNASASAEAGTILTGTATAQVEIDPPANPSLQIRKVRTTSSPAEVGQTVSFQISVINNGNTPLTDVDVYDTFPAANLVFLNATPVPTSVNPGSIQWQNIESNAPGGTFDPGEIILLTVNFTAIAPTPVGALSVNSALAFAESNSIVAGPAMAGFVIDAAPFPDIEITKLLTSSDPTTVGELVTFSIEVANIGNTVLTDVDIADTFDTGNLDFNNASLAPSAINEGAGTLSWNNIESSAPGGTFDPGETITITVEFIATAGTIDPFKAKNEASVSALGGNVFDGPSVASVEIEEPGIAISKVRLTPDPTTVGATVVFRITLTNIGTTQLTGVNVLDNFETQYFDWLSNSVPADSVDEALGVINWVGVESEAPGGTFDPGEQIVIDSSFTADAPTSIAPASNSAAVSAEGGSLSDGPDSASVSIYSPVTNPLVDIACTTVGARDIRVEWTDDVAGQSDFQLQAAVGGSAFMTLDPTVSSSSGPEGDVHATTLESLLPSSDHSFRVRGFDAGGKPLAWTDPTEACTTAAAPVETLGCISGSVYAQGRTNHAGMAIYVDGAPATTTQADGSFRVCQVPAGIHDISAGSDCFLKTVRVDTAIEGGQDLVLPTISLRGGDVNADHGVDIFDLVRVGAGFRSSPPSDELADCTGDGAIDIFDLVLVGSNYDKAGPLEWALPGSQASAEAPRLPFLRPTALPSAAPVTLQERILDDQTVAVDLVLRTDRALYGADLSLRYDASKVEPLPAETGGKLRAEPGKAWGANVFIARNTVDTANQRVRFAASLQRPAEPFTGEVVLATLRFRVIGNSADGAFRFESAKLADPQGRSIDPTQAGVGVGEPGLIAPRERTIYLPYALR